MRDTTFNAIHRVLKRAGDRGLRAVEVAKLCDLSPAGAWRALRQASAAQLIEAEYLGGAVTIYRLAGRR